MLRGSGKYTTRRERAIGPRAPNPSIRAHQLRDVMTQAPWLGGKRGLLLQAEDSKTATPHARIRAAGEVRFTNRLFSSYGYLLAAKLWSGRTTMNCPHNRPPWSSFCDRCCLRANSGAMNALSIVR